MAARVHRPLRVIAFNADGIWRRRYELSKQLQDLHVDVAVLSKAHLKPHERFLIPNYNFYRTGRFPGRKGIPHNHVHLCYMQYLHLTKVKPIRKRQSHFFVKEDVTLRTRTARVQLQKGTISGRQPQGAWCRDELISGKPPVVK
jgi:hypothetical protein